MKPVWCDNYMIPPGIIYAVFLHQTGSLLSLEIRPVKKVCTQCPDSFGGRKCYLEYLLLYIDIVCM